MYSITEEKGRKQKTKSTGLHKYAKATEGLDAFSQRDYCRNAQAALAACRQACWHGVKEKVICRRCRSQVRVGGFLLIRVLNGLPMDLPADFSTGTLACEAQKRQKGRRSKGVFSLMNQTELFTYWDMLLLQQAFSLALLFKSCDPFNPIYPSLS